MSEQKAAEIASFFDKEREKKQKTQNKKQQQVISQQKKQEELQKKIEEEKKAAAQTGDFESSDEEDTRAQIEGVAKVKDIKEVKKVKDMEKAAEREQDFWKTMETGIQGGASHQQPKEAPKQQDNKGGFHRGGIDQKKTGLTSQFQKDGITFSKGKPQFKKSEHVGNKGEFPELGQEEGKRQEQSKAAIGGPIGQVSAPAKSTRPQNKFDSLQEKDEEDKRKQAAPLQ